MLSVFTWLHIYSMLLHNNLKNLFLGSELKLGEENDEEEVEACLRGFTVFDTRFDYIVVELV